jgi:xanthine dehydrogenase accessory factor
MRNSEGRTRHVAIIIGSDEVGSAVAVVLHRAGLAVVICDDVDPPWARRGMTFTNAWYVGNAELDGEAAVFCSSVKSIPAVLQRERLIAATTWSWSGIATALPPLAIIDCRSRKRDPGGGPKSRAPDGTLTIGIGGGFVAGNDVDIVISAASDNPQDATVIEGPIGAGAADESPIDRAARECLLHAPRGGRFATSRRIGDSVVEREIVGAVGTVAIAAPIGGVLRGLTARGARVAQGDLIVEVDPRGDPVRCFGPDERALVVARRVESALVSVIDGAAMHPNRAVAPGAALGDASIAG